MQYCPELQEVLPHPQASLFLSTPSVKEHTGTAEQVCVAASQKGAELVQMLLPHWHVCGLGDVMFLLEQADM